MRRIVIVSLALFLLQSCAPARTSRPSRPPPSPPPAQVSLPARSPEPKGQPVVVEEAKIREEDLKEKRSVPAANVKERPGRAAPSREFPPALPDDSSLIAKITPRTPPQRAASLRLTEEGRKLLDAGEYPKALARLERTISIDSTNAYGYYYLAKAHYHLSRYQESLNFLDVAESLLSGEPYWLAEALALRGENFRALGFLERADISYSQALRLNPGNRVASEGLGALRGGTQPSPR